MNTKCGMGLPFNGIVPEHPKRVKTESGNMRSTHKNHLDLAVNAKLFTGKEKLSLCANGYLISSTSRFPMFARGIEDARNANASSDTRPTECPGVSVSITSARQLSC